MEDRLVEAGEVGGDGGALKIESEVEGGKNLADAEDAVEIDGANFCEFEGFLQGAQEEVVVPGGAVVGADGEEEGLGGARFGAFVVEGYSGALVGAGDSLGPLVEEEAGVGSLGCGVALGDAGEGYAAFIGRVGGVDSEAQPAVGGLQGGLAE